MLVQHRMNLQLARRHQRTNLQAVFLVEGNLVQARQAAEAHDVARRAKLLLDLHQQVGAAGEDVELRAMAREKRHRFLQRVRLEIVESIHGLNAAARLGSGSGSSSSSRSW